MNVPMSNVTVSVSAEEHITAETVKLVFNAVYAIQDETIDARAEVEKAAKELIPNADWYVIGMNRDKDRTGIEVVTYQMNVRVKESVLNGLNAAIERVNRKGLSFELYNTDYTPTVKQMEEANVSLRKTLYSKAKAEVELLNELLNDGDEKWTIGNVQFMGAPGVAKNMMATAQVYNGRGMGLESAAMGGGMDEEEAGITQKVSLSAQVILTRKIYSRL